MDNSCDCAHCPHSCGDDNEETEKNADEQISKDDNDDNLDEEPANTEAMAVEKVEKLKQAIIALGFNIETTEKGLKISR